MCYLSGNRHSYSFWSYQFKSFFNIKKCLNFYIFRIVSRIYFLLKEILYILKTSRSTFYWTSCVKEKLKVQGNQLLNNGPWWRRLSSQPAFFSFWIFFLYSKFSFWLNTAQVKISYFGSFMGVIFPWDDTANIYLLSVWPMQCRTKIRSI